MSATSPLRAVKVQAFSNATVTGLASDINAWITANAGQRTMLALDFDVLGGNAVAYLTFTE